MAGGYVPGTAQLKAAYAKTGLSFLGIDFDKAMAVDSIRIAITCKAKRAYLDAHKNSRPAFIQPVLF